MEIPCTVVIQPGERGGGPTGLGSGRLSPLLPDGMRSAWSSRSLCLLPCWPWRLRLSRKSLYKTALPPGAGFLGPCLGMPRGRGPQREEVPRPLFWLRPRLDPLPIVFQAVDDLGPTGWDRLVPLGLATSSAHGSQPGWPDGSQSLAGLREDLCSQSLEPPARDVWGVSVNMESAHLLKTRNHSGRKADRGPPALV